MSYEMNSVKQAFWALVGYTFTGPQGIDNTVAYNDIANNSFSVGLTHR